MKKLIILYVGFLSVFGLLLSSCDSMNDIQQKFVEGGEKIYLGISDSVTVFSGYEKVKLTWYMNDDPRLETTVIYWNLRKDSMIHEIKRTADEIQIDSVIIDKNMDGTPLSEGAYIFELVNTNKYGERSLPVMAQGRAYGEMYASELTVRPVSNMSVIGFDPQTQASTVKITWSSMPEGSVGTKVTYKKRSTGEEVVVNVDEEATETTLTDVGNRLGHPDDVIYISSIHAPEGCIDFIESSKRKEQTVLYLASGSRIENTEYEGNNTIFTNTYTHQEKTLRLISTVEGSRRVYDCSRVAELSPATMSTLFRITLFDDNTISFEGNYAAPLNVISKTEATNSAYDPVTGNFSLQYMVKTAGGAFTIDETLVPKNTPFEVEAPKPFVDKRANVPGDNNTVLTENYLFSYISDGIYPPNKLPGRPDHGWIGANNGLASVTFDLNEKMKLTRMILWPSIFDNYDAVDVYAYGNCMKFEVWGSAEWDAGKESDVAYWADATDPAGTYKADWTFLGYHEVERLDKKNATDQEMIDRGRYGNHFILPQAAGAVRYIRFINRESVPITHVIGGVGSISQFFIGELSFYGYTQE